MDSKAPFGTTSHDLWRRGASSVRWAVWCRQVFVSFLQSRVLLTWILFLVKFCLPPHGTHRMQTLDVSFYGPLKTYFNQKIGALLNKAYGKASTVQTAVNGFQNTGIWLVDPNVFPDYLFEPAETTNIPMQQDRIEPEEYSTAAKNLAGSSQVVESTTTSLIIASTSAADNPCPLSVAQSRDIVTSIPTTPTSSKMILQDVNINVPISVLSPVPKRIYVSGQGERKLHKKPTVLLLTSTPNIEETEAKSALPSVPKKNTRKVTKTLGFSSDSENGLSPFLETGYDDEDSPCINCNDLYSRSKPKEVWLKCLRCETWAMHHMQMFRKRRSVLHVNSACNRLYFVTNLVCHFVINTCVILPA
ncbi:hypothetical protein WA026_004141 [Henosepilachna vigintioctopunctata]|uniref:Uncharacterized protein n=1 Tax=Henosepilachna vigintioctopunctata TaxID=420089 RepID=A0AAW1UGN4_9CUCU